MTKTNKTRIKELREELRYWQGRTRMDLKSLERTKAKCKQIAMQMRDLQAHQTLDKREPRC